MELMWLVYAVENLTYNGSFFMKAFGVIIGATLAALIITGMTYIDSKGSFTGWWKNVYPKNTVISLVTICLVLHTVLPSRDTAIKMAGAYLIQTVVTSEKANKLGDAAYRATLRQLEKWAAEVPELNEMVQDMNNELKVEEGK